MRIESIALDWFRGAAHSAILETASKNIVVYGANGSGKSTFADAIEYVVAGGKIEHLAHEHSGSRQEKGVINTHCPAGISPSIKLKFTDDSSVHVKISANGMHSVESSPTQLAKDLQNLKVEQLLLRQDKVADFIHSTKGEKYSVLLPMFGLAPLEQSAQNLLALQQRLTVKVGVPEKQGELGALRSNLEEFFPEVTEQKILDELKQLASAYLTEVPNELGELVSEMSASIETRISTMEPETRRHSLLSQINDVGLADRLATLVEAEKTAQSQMDALIDSRIAVIRSTSDFLAKIQEGQEEVECPSCGRLVEVTELAAHLESEQALLNEASAARDGLRAGRRQFASALQNAINLIGREDLSLWLDGNAQRDFKSSIEELRIVKLETPEDGWSVDDRKIIDNQVPNVVKKSEPP